MAITFLFFLSGTLFSNFSTAQETSQEKEALLVAKKTFEDEFYDVSLTLFKSFLDKFPQSVLVSEANFYIGQCYFNQKKYNDAITCFKKLLNLKSAGTFGDRLYYWIAEAYFKSNDFIRAYNYYTLLLAEYPKSAYVAHAFYSLGWCLLEQDKFEEAKEKFIEFKNQFPKDALRDEADFKVVECLYNLKDYVKLKNYLEQLALDQPESLDAAHPGTTTGAKNERAGLLKFYLAEAYFYLNEYARALDNYSKALSLSKEDRNLTDLIYLGLGWSYLKLNDYLNAKANFDKVLQNNTKEKNIESALWGEALILQLNSQFSQALEGYTRLIAQAKSPAIIFEGYAGKAEVLYNLENYPESVSAYKEAKRYIGNEISDSSLNRLNYGLGLSYLKSGSFSEALSEFNSLANKVKDDDRFKVLSLSRAADTYLESGDSVTALDIYRNIVRDYPNCQNCAYIENNIGLALLNLKQYAQAIEVFEAILAKYEESQTLEDVYFYLGTAYYELGDFLNSYLQLKNFISKYPAHNLHARAAMLEGLSLKSLKRFQEAYDTLKTVSSYGQEVHLLARAEFELTDCLYYLGRKDEALKRLEFLRSKYPDSEISSLVLLRLAEHYLEVNKLDLCQRYLLELINSHPDGSLLDDSYYMLGLCFEKKGLYEEALDSFKRIEGMYAEIYPKIADIYKYLGKFQDAIFYYRMSLKENDVNKEQISFKLAECLEETGLLQEAAQEYCRINQDQVLMIKGLLRSGKIYENQENWQLALNVYEKISSLEVEESKYARERIGIIKGEYLK